MNISKKNQYQFSHSVMSDSLWLHGLQHARLPCPSLSPWVCSNLCPLSLILGYTPFSCPQSSPALGSFQWVGSWHQVAKVWSFSFSISLSNEYSGSISFRIVWFDLVVRGALKSLLQHHNLKASVLSCSAFLMVQLSHLYLTIGKTIALTLQTFVSKLKFLLFNMLSRFVTVFFPRSKHL